VASRSGSSGNGNGSACLQIMMLACLDWLFLIALWGWFGKFQTIKFNRPRRMNKISHIFPLACMPNIIYFPSINSLLYSRSNTLFPRPNEQFNYKLSIRLCLHDAPDGFPSRLCPCVYVMCQWCWSLVCGTFINFKCFTFFATAALAAYAYI